MYLENTSGNACQHLYARKRSAAELNSTPSLGPSPMAVFYKAIMASMTLGRYTMLS